MGILTFSINVTLDGCVDHREGIADDETHAFFTRLMDEGGAMLWGRVTYEMMESYWPAVARGDEEAPPALREWAVKLEAKPKYVVSSTRRDFPWTNSHHLAGDLRTSVQKLKDATPARVLLGSGNRFQRNHASLTALRFLAISAALGTCVLPGCASTSRSPVTPQLVERELSDRALAFSAAVVAASASGWAQPQVNRLAEFYTDSTVVFPPRGSPLRGRDAVRTYWARSPDNRILSHRIDVERLDVSETLAGEHGRIVLQVQTGSAAPTEYTARYVSIWLRGADGQWRKQLDTWW